MKIIAFDPGKTGGVAWSIAGEVNAEIMPIAGDELDLFIIKKLFEMKPDLVVIEKQWARPDNGTKQAFALGDSYGLLKGLCSGLDIPYELVAPVTWKKLILSDTKKDKNAAIEYCRRVYPTVSLLRTPKCRNPHDGMADALCILTYGLRKFGSVAA